MGSVVRWLVVVGLIVGVGFSGRAWAAESPEQLARLIEDAIKKQDVEAMIPLILFKEAPRSAKVFIANEMMRSAKSGQEDVTGVQVLSKAEEPQLGEVPNSIKLNRPVLGYIKISTEDHDGKGKTEALQPFGEVDGQFYLLIRARK